MRNHLWAWALILLLFINGITIYGAGHTADQWSFWALFLMPMAIGIAGYMWGDEV